MMQQRTEEWLEWRRTKIGASDAATIMGCSPWSKPFDLWMEKKGFSEPKEMTMYMTRGVDMEEDARSCFERMTGFSVFPECKTHPKYDWMVASLDGVDFTGKVIVEIKCPGAKAHAMAGTGSVPVHYLPQLQHQMEVCGVDEMFYFSYNGSEGIILKVYRNQSYIDKMMDMELKFWHLMQQDTYPMAPIFMQDSDKILARRYKECKQKMKALESEEKALREQLLDYCEDKDYTVDDIKITRIEKAGLIDYKSIPELAKIDLEKYRKPSTEYWKITILGEE